MKCFIDIHTRLSAILCCLILSQALQAETATEGIPIPPDTLEPFFEQHCIRCHGPDKEKGQVRVDELAYSVTQNDQAQRWQDILDVLNGAEMPPDYEEQPTPEELTEVLNVLTKHILKARQHLTDHGGKVALRKLNRREYINTARELFGFNLKRSHVPADAHSEHFDTIGTDQQFSPHQFDLYLERGKSLVQQGISWAQKPQKEPTTRRVHLEEEFKKKANDFIKQEKLVKRAEEYLSMPHIDTGTYLMGIGSLTGNDIQVNHSVDPRGSYKIRISAGLHGDPQEIRKFIYVGESRSETSQVTHAVLKVNGTPESPEVIEWDQAMPFQSTRFNFFVSENRSAISPNSRTGPAAIWVDWVEFEGPHYPSRSFFEKLYRSRKWDDDNVADLIEKFSYAAFRRNPASANYQAGLLEFFQARRKEGVKFEQAVTEVLGLVLASPMYLYLAEGVETPGQLSDREFAVRLAYFLWGGPPDTQLYNEAERGDLSDPQKLRGIVDRMLIDPRSQGFYEGFVGQWADLDRYDEIMNSIPKKKFRHFNKGIQYSAKQEVLRFFKVLVDENLSVSNLIDSDFIVANECLATHYGFLGLGTNEFVKVLLPDDSPRGGLMTQATFLSVGSNGERNSAVIRGAMVMEKLLDDKIPEPPPNVPELDSSSETPLSQREMILLHQRKPQCASCHKKMDPIGFALENFDLTGSWRKFEDVGDVSVKIRSDGVFPNGAEFSDINEMRAQLMQYKDELAGGMIKSLLSYGLGRTIEFSDTNNIEAIRESLKATDYAMLDMIHAVVSDPIFRTK